ncbi:Glutathione synthetase [Dimargaris xerosporica]|nr:Glutathione synthetase [Dimargaris xerosporica]
MSVLCKFSDAVSDSEDPAVQCATTTAVDWALAHGLVMKPAAVPTSAPSTDVVNQGGHAQHAPFALFPTPFPKACFDQAVGLQPALNCLFDRISRDYDFLAQCMKSVVTVDEFTAKLYKVYQQTRTKPSPQTITLGLHRSDYLLHQPQGSGDLTIYQVEFNTISTSFAGLAPMATQLHQYLRDDPTYADLLAQQIAVHQAKSLLPNNSATTHLVDGLAKAWQLYGCQSAIVVMAVQVGERNVFDQLRLTYDLRQRYGIIMIRQTLAELRQGAHIDPTTQALVLNGTEVAVVYYRTCYAPTDYASSADWETRLIVEQSRAIKAPTVAYQLAGTKKVQQVLTEPGVLERFIPNSDDCARVRACFTGLYPLDDSSLGLAAVRRALEAPEGYVMKPQREGGGNNVYRKDIPTFLQGLPVEEREAYILMDLIKPPVVANLLVHQGRAQKGAVISELGIYGVWLSHHDQVHLNESAGHILRTKVASSNEGGIAAGFGAIDSPALVDKYLVNDDCEYREDENDGNDDNGDDSDWVKVPTRDTETKPKDYDDHYMG